MNELSMFDVFEFAGSLFSHIKSFAEEQIPENHFFADSFEEFDNEFLSKNQISVQLLSDRDIVWKSKFVHQNLKSELKFQSKEVFNPISVQQKSTLKFGPINPAYYKKLDYSFVLESAFFERFYVLLSGIAQSEMQIMVVFNLSKLLASAITPFSQVLLAKELFDNTEEMYFMVDKNAHFILKNKAFIAFESQIFSLTNYELTALWLRNIKEHLAKITESKQKLGIETKYIIGEKKIILRCQYTPFYIDNELLVIATYIDITEQAIKKLKLVKELSFLHKFLEFSNIGYLFFDEKNQLISYNKRAQEFLPSHVLHHNRSKEEILDAIRPKIDKHSYDRLCKIVYHTDASACDELNLIYQKSFLKLSKSIISYKKDSYVAYSLENISALKRQTFALERQNNFLSILAYIGNNLLKIHSQSELFENLNWVLNDTLGPNYFIVSFKYDSAENIFFDYHFLGINLEPILHFSSENQVDNLNVANLIEPLQLNTKLMTELSDYAFLSPLFEVLGWKFPSKDLFKLYLRQFADDNRRYYCSLIGTIEDSDDIVLNYLESIFNQFYGRLISILQFNQIIEQRESAINLSKAKSDFVSNITHEIKNPMSSILGFSRLLEKSDLEPKAMDYARIIRKNTEQLLKIIQDLSDISRIESNTLKINMEEIDLLSLFNELKELYIHYCEINEKVQLYFDFNEFTHVFIYADFIRLKQILINFISNALKYTPDGYVKVSYTLLSNGKVKIFVEDSGPGLSNEDAKRIFNRYERAKAKLRNKEGVGIGLSIAQELALKMGTEITLSFELGLGSIFSIVFEKVIEKEFNQNILVANDNNVLSDRKLMVVEDDINTIQFYKFFFSELQIDFIICKNAFEAEIALKKNLPDIIFCDIRMPGKNGLEFFEENKQLIGDIPFYFITADSSSEIKNQAMELGAREVMYKPIDPQKIKQVLIQYQFTIRDIL